MVVSAATLMLGYDDGVVVVVRLVTCIRAAHKATLAVFQRRVEARRTSIRLKDNFRTHTHTQAHTRAVDFGSIFNHIIL